MSKRHQDSKPLRSNREMRKQKTRRDRHQAHQDLHTAADVDDLVVAEPVHDRAPRHTPERRRLRHWKLKSWKRRNAERRARNSEVDALRLADE